MYLTVNVIKFPNFDNGQWKDLVYVQIYILSIHMSVPCPCTNKAGIIAADEVSNHIVMTKTSKSATNTVDCPVDSAFPVAIMMLEKSFHVSNGFSSAQLSSFSLITWRYELLSTMTFRSLWWQSHRDATTFSWKCLFECHKKYSHAWKQLQLCILSVQIPSFLASKFPTSSPLSSRSCDIAFECLPSQLYAEENSCNS